MEANETTELTEEKTKKLAAKTCSKVTIIFCCLWIAALTICRGLGFFPGLDQDDVIYSGIAMAALWSPTYLSVWLDKIRDIKLGNSTGGEQ